MTLWVPAGTFGLHVIIRGDVSVYSVSGSKNPDKGAGGIISREWVAKIGKHEIPVSHPKDFRLIEKDDWLVMVGDYCYHILPQCEYARAVRHYQNAPQLPPTDLKNQQGNLAVDFQKTLISVPKVLYHAPSKKRDEPLINDGKIPFKPAPFLRKHSDRNEGMSDNIIGTEKSEKEGRKIILNMPRVVSFCAFCMSKTPEGAAQDRSDRNVYEVNTEAFVTSMFESFKNLRSLEEINVSGFTDTVNGQSGGKLYCGPVGMTLFLREVEYYDERDHEQEKMQNFGQRKISKFSCEKEVRLILICWPDPDKEEGRSFLPVDFPHLSFDFASSFRQVT